LSVRGPCPSAGARSIVNCDQTTPDPLRHMNGPIRIALVITELEPGGAERCLVHLARGLPPDCFETAVYSLAPRPAAGRDVLVHRLEQAAIPVHFLDARSAWQAPATLLRLRLLLREHSPDIVQTFLFHANVLGSLAVGGKDRPALFTGVRVADPSRWRQRLEAWTSRRAHRVVCVSQAVADFCGSQAAFPRDKLSVIANGIDPSGYPPGRRLPPGRVGLPEDRRILLFVGRLHRQKAVDWLLSLAPRFLDRLPQHDLVLAGDGPQRLELEHLATRRGIAHRIRFLGLRDDIPDLLAAADLLVLPSLWEGMPNVVLEAMASGLPVVATRAAGVMELLGPLADQQTIPFGDGQALTDAILRIAEQPGLASALGQANRQRATDQFSLDRMIQAYAELYQKAR
jgi:glycosyltransferase involved in cell wall biosynthesis